MIFTDEIPDKRQLWRSSDWGGQLLLSPLRPFSTDTFRMQLDVVGKSNATLT
jgi:hypothetical protein